jgi:hypothetical protein
MVAEGHATEEETTTHKGTLVWRAGAAIKHPDGWGPRVLFQLVPNPKSVKNRMHLDVRVGGAGNIPAVKEVLLGRGATFLHDGHQGPFVWITMADPEGNEFCVG